MKFPQTEISEVAKFINGFAFKPKDWGEKGYPIIRIQNLTNSSKPFNRTERNVPEQYLVKKGDILVSWSATIDIFEWHLEDSLLNQHIFKVVFDEKKINKSYFKLALKQTIKELSRFAHGATMKHIVKRDFENHKISLPSSLKDQIRIATLLSRIEALITTRKENLNLLDEFLKSTFLEIFGDPVQNEKEWDFKPLEEIGTVNRGVSKHRPRNAPELLGGKYPLIQTGDVTQAGTYITEYKQTYSEIGFKQSKLWPKETLCITIAANIARTGILKFESCFPDSVVGFIADKEETTPIYIHFLFGFFQRILEKNAPQAAQKNINLKILRTLKVPVPPLEKQQNFEKIVLKVESIKLLFQKNLNELENLYGSVSQKAFKGELDLSSLPIPDKDIQIEEISTDYKEIIRSDNKEHEMINTEPFSKAALEKYLRDNKGKKLSSSSILKALKEEYSIHKVDDYFFYLTELLEKKSTGVEQVFSIMTKNEKNEDAKKEIGIYIK